MAQVIMMSREYNCRPSEIIFIDDEYLAYCFDEVAFYLLKMATDKEGNIDWRKIRWRGTEKKGNKEFVRFLKKHTH